MVEATRLDWARGRAKSRAGTELVASWVVVTVWTALSAPLVWKLFSDASVGSSPWVWLLILFPLVGVWLWIVTVRLSLGWLRFGRTELELDPSPGSLGGHAGGTLDVPLRHRTASDYRITLSCVRSHVSGRGKNRSRSESVVWSHEMIPAVERMSRGIRLAFTFDVPPHLPPTEARSASYHYWSIRVVGDVPGLNLDRAYEIPVVRSDVPTRSASPAYGTAPPTPLNTPDLGPVGVDRRIGHTVLSFPAGRQRASALAMVIFGAVFLGFPLFMMITVGREYWSGGGLGLAIVVFAGPVLFIFTVVGLVVLVLGLYLLLNHLEVRISDTELSSTRRLLGFSRTRVAEVGEVDRIEMRIDGQVGSGAKASVSYALRAHLKGGGRLPLGDGIRGPTLANGLAELVTEETGLPVVLVERKKGKRNRGNLTTHHPSSGESPPSSTRRAD